MVGIGLKRGAYLGEFRGLAEGCKFYAKFFVGLEVYFAWLAWLG